MKILFTILFVLTLFFIKANAQGICKDSTYIIQHDSLVSAHFDTTFGYKDTVVYPIASSVIRVFRDMHFKQVIISGVPKDSVIKYVVRLPYDSVYTCSLCARHDTTFCPATTYGVFILSNDSISTPTQKIVQAKYLGCTAIRYNYLAGNNYVNKVYKDSGMYVYQMFNTADVSTGPHPFPTDFAAMNKTADSVWAISKPDHVGFLNEPPNPSYWYGTPQQYIAALTSFVTHAHAAGIQVSDGGELFGIVYYMALVYNNAGDTASLNNLSRKTGISVNNLLNTSYAHGQQAWYSYLIPNIRLTGVDNIDLHWYEPPMVADSASTVVSGVLPLVVDFMQTQTGLKVITSETGTRNHSLTLFNAMFGEWKLAGVTPMFYFDGAGPLAVPNEQYYKNFIINNP